jgi:hypothetical protein
VKIELVDNEKAFLPLVVMKEMEGFEELNRILEEKFGKKMLVKGEAKLKNYKLVTSNLLFEWNNDITDFRISGEADLLKKSLIKEEKIATYSISIDYTNKIFDVSPIVKREVVLPLVCLLVLEAIRNVAREVKKK